ncbi:MAG: hypothetical protein JXR37_18910 [Kiritimatiellae bacterium]|nr:hypothetical protein [Kiritimatiellia bacterium]
MNKIVNSGDWNQGAIRVSAGNWNRAMDPSVWHKGAEACHETVVCGNTGNGAVVLGYGHGKQLGLPVTDTKWCAGNTLAQVCVAQTGMDTRYRYTGDVGVAWAPTRDEVGPLATNDAGPLSRPPASTNSQSRAPAGAAAGALAPPVAPEEMRMDR